MKMQNQKIVFSIQTERNIRCSLPLAESNFLRSILNSNWTSLGTLFKIKNNELLKTPYTQFV